MKEHEHKESYNENIISLHTHLFYYFKNNKIIYKLSNKVYKATYKKYNTVY